MDSIAILRRYYLTLLASERYFGDWRDSSGEENAGRPPEPLISTLFDEGYGILAICWLVGGRKSQESRRNEEVSLDSHATEGRGASNERCWDGELECNVVGKGLREAKRIKATRVRKVSVSCLFALLVLRLSLALARHRSFYALRRNQREHGPDTDLGGASIEWHAS